jgi:hypothetical protein
MTELLKNQLREIVSKRPRSIWSYWGFVLPVILVIIGIGAQVALLAYFKHQHPELEICLRQGTKIQLMWDSDLVKKAVLTVSRSIALTFALLAFLARISFKQMQVLILVAKELGIEETPSAKKTM